MMIDIVYTMSMRRALNTFSLGASSPREVWSIMIYECKIEDKLLIGREISLMVKKIMRKSLLTRIRRTTFTVIIYYMCKRET